MDNDEKIIWSNVKLQWHTDLPPYENIDSIIQKYCAKSLSGLEKVSELIFHTIFLSESLDEHVVIVWGELDSEDLHCDYQSQAKWESLLDIDNANENN
jgi:hypothetical protein